MPNHLRGLGAGGEGVLAPLCDIPSGCCSFTGPWTVTRSSLRMLRRVAAFCRPLRPVLLLVSFPRSWSPVVGVPGAVLDVAGCAVCASAAPDIWRIEDVLVVAGVVCPPPKGDAELLSKTLVRPPVPNTGGQCGLPSGIWTPSGAAAAAIAGTWRWRPTRRWCWGT